MKYKQPIVVIGGMGPQASCALYQLLIDQAVQQHGVVDNEDFPHIVLQSLSVPDFIGSQDRQAEAKAIMRQAAKTAVQARPSVVGMACNTAHLFAGDMLAGLELPFVSLIDTVADQVSEQGLQRVGLLASPTTIKTGLYETALQARAIDCLLPSLSQQIDLELVIRAVIAGTAGVAEASQLRLMADDLIAQGSEGIVLGCTELPLIFPKQGMTVPVFDCLELLATKLLVQYYQQFAVNML